MPLCPYIHNWFSKIAKPLRKPEALIRTKESLSRLELETQGKVVAGREVSPVVRGWEKTPMQASPATVSHHSNQNSLLSPPRAEGICIEGREQ